MKKYKKITLKIATLVMFLAVGLITSCHDDEFYTNENGSSLEMQDKFKISRFSLKAERWLLPDTIKSFTLKLRSLTDQSEMNFDTEIIRNGQMCEFRILIPNDMRIPDSDYRMSGHDKKGRSYGRELKVTFQDEMLIGVIGDIFTYSELAGNGTESDPYLIRSSDDFDIFRFALDDDKENHARNLFFEQKRNISVSYTTGVNDGQGYTGYNFAGSYNGNGHKINLQITAGKGDNLGLFHTLLGGARIKDLTIEGRINDGGTNIGALAGSCVDTVKVDSVTSLINITDDKSATSCVGGLIGNMISGKLLIKNCHMGASIVGASHVGGILGQMTQGELIVENVSRAEGNSPKVSGRSHVGFICGSVQSGSVELNDVSAIYTIDEGSKTDIMSGENYVGGLIGSATLTGDSHIKNCTVNLPPAQKEINISYLGGICGHVNSQANFTLDNCLVQSPLINGLGTGQDTNGEYIGGVIGKMEVSDSKTFKIANGCSVTGCTVIGNRYVGGMFGSLSARNITIDSRKPSIINVDVEAHVIRAGSICGELYKGTLDVSNDNFNIDPSCSILSIQDAGGIVGFCDGAEIKGSVPNNVYFPRIVKKQEFIPYATFSGTISIIENKDMGESFGGIVGAAFSSKVHNVCFNGTLDGKRQIGGIMGYAQDTEFEHCVNICSELDASDWIIGGIVGKYVGTGKLSPLKNSYLLNYSRIGSKKQVNDTGGIIGKIDMLENQKDSYFEWMVNTGAVCGSNQVGGCIGTFEYRKKYHDNVHPDQMYKGFIREAANYGTIESTQPGFVGGILGYAYTQTLVISRSVNHGYIHAHLNSTGNSDNESSAGGIVGRLGIDADGSKSNKPGNGRVEECCNFGTIESDNTAWSWLGGIVGYKQEGEGGDVFGPRIKYIWGALDREDVKECMWWCITDCYNHGTINSKTGQAFGGIAGFVDWNNEVRHCINLGQVGNGNGLIGETKDACRPSKIECFLLENMSKVDKEKNHYDVCKVLNSDDMKNKGCLSGLDFDRIWKLDEYNDGYPHFGRTNASPEDANRFQFVYPDK